MPRPVVGRPRALGFADLRLAVDVPAGTIAVAGSLDRSTAHHLSDAVSALRSSHAAAWTLDLSGVTFCDIEGVRVLLRARRLAAAHGRVLHERSPSPVLTDLLALVEGLRWASDVPGPQPGRPDEAG